MPEQQRDRDVFWAAIRDGYSYEQADVRQLRADRDRDDVEDGDDRG